MTIHFYLRVMFSVPRSAYFVKLSCREFMFCFTSHRYEKPTSLMIKREVESEPWKLANEWKTNVSILFFHIRFEINIYDFQEQSISYLLTSQFKRGTFKGKRGQ